MALILLIKDFNISDKIREVAIKDRTVRKGGDDMQTTTLSH